MHPILATILLCAFCSPSEMPAKYQTDDSYDAKAFFLIEKGDAVDILSVDIPDGDEVKIERKDLISIVMSLGIGQSGDFVQKGMRASAYTIRNKKGRLTVRCDRLGKSFSLPVMNTRTLQNAIIRVNVKSENEKTFLFQIHGYELIQKIDGPVLDMFAGKLPLHDGDYSITLETRPIPDINYLTGKANCVYEGDLLLVNVVNSEKKSGRFAVDLAASTSVIEQDFAPSGTAINKLEAIEYLAGTKNSKKGVMKGATGNVAEDSFLGQAWLLDVSVGGIVFDKLQANVIKEFPPELKKLGIVGILGGNALSRCSCLRFVKLENGQVEMVFAESAEAEPDHSIEVSRAAGLWFANGSLANTQCNLLLDTGARRSMVWQSFIEENSIKTTRLGNEKQLRGLSGQPIRVKEIELSELELGDIALVPWTALSGDIPVFQSLGIQDLGGILGLDFFRRFSIVEFDFSKQSMNLFDSE